MLYSYPSAHKQMELIYALADLSDCSLIVPVLLCSGDSGATDLFPFAGFPLGAALLLVLADAGQNVQGLDIEEASCRQRGEG